MALLDAIEGCMELTVEASHKAVPEELKDGAGRNRGEGEFTGALEQTVDGEVTVEDDIATPLDPGDEVVQAQARAGRFSSGKLWPEQEGPVLDALPDTFGSEPAAGKLEEIRIRNGNKGVVVTFMAEPVTGDELLQVVGSILA